MREYIIDNKLVYIENRIRKSVCKRMDKDRKVAFIMNQIHMRMVTFERELISYTEKLIRENL